jgi:membrane protease YdiL (CAAX protease family)
MKNMITSTQTKKLIATPKPARLWLVLLAGPLLFFLGIVLASIYFSIVLRGDVAAIPERVAASTPYQLVAIQILLFFILRWAMRRDGLAWKDIGWKTTDGQQTWREALIGAVPGAALGLLYVFVLSPGLTWIQQTLGDYVPAGELMPSLGAAIVPFFIANVVLAPFVEENIYRGYALTRWFERFSKPVAILLSCIFFGLLHWAGGFWYILLTGFVAGGLFAGLYSRRKTMMAPFAAHLALNVVEISFYLPEILTIRLQVV